MRETTSGTVAPAVSGVLCMFFCTVLRHARQAACYTHYYLLCHGPMDSRLYALGPMSRLLQGLSHTCAHTHTHTPLPIDRLLARADTLLPMDRPVARAHRADLLKVIIRSAFIASPSLIPLYFNVTLLSRSNLFQWTPLDGVSFISRKDSVLYKSCS